MTDPGGPLDVVAVGSAVLDRYYRLSNLPDPDGGAFVRDAWWDFGGVAANVAAMASRLGRDAGVLTRLGTDDRGTGLAADAILADLRERGVDTSRVRRGDERGAYSLILAGPDGERMVVSGGESVEALELDGADWPYLRGARAVVTTAYTPESVVAPLVEARADGDLPPLAFDLSGPLSELTDRGVTPGTIDAAVGAAGLFVAGEVALRSYCESHGVDPADAVGFLRSSGVRRAALTRGDDGATLVTPDRVVDVDAVDVDAVDTTGAGDAFLGALVDAWLLGDRPPVEAGQFASVVAALNCTGVDARGGVTPPSSTRQHSG